MLLRGGKRGRKREHAGAGVATLNYIGRKYLMERRRGTHNKKGGRTDLGEPMLQVGLSPSASEVAGANLV